MAQKAPAELSPADAFEAALAEALAKQSLLESGGEGNSKGTGQDNSTLTPPNTPAIGNSPPAGAVIRAQAAGNHPEMAMHAIPEDTVEQDRVALPAPKVQLNKAESTAPAATITQAPVNAQVTDLASVILPEQYSKLLSEPSSPATTVGSRGTAPVSAQVTDLASVISPEQYTKLFNKYSSPATTVGSPRPEAVQLGREWSVLKAGTLHVGQALKNLDTQGNGHADRIPFPAPGNELIEGQVRVSMASRPFLLGLIRFNI